MRFELRIADVTDMAVVSRPEYSSAVEHLSTVRAVFVAACIAADLVAFLAFPSARRTLATTRGTFDEFGHGNLLSKRR